MRTSWVFAVAGAAAAMTAVGLATTAQADAALNGVYTVEGGADQFLATARTSCTPSGCSGTVSSNRGWTAPAALVDGRWNFAFVKPDGFVCADGSFAPVRVIYSVDPSTLTGVISADSNGDCPGGVVTQTPIRLRQVG